MLIISQKLENAEQLTSILFTLLIKKTIESLPMKVEQLKEYVRVLTCCIISV